MDSGQRKAVIYCRVSTKEQVEEGNSLATQERLCREYADKFGYKIAATFIEMGESAKTADRTELKKMFAFCSTKKNKIAAVIAYKIDRISRNTDDYSQIRILLKRYGVEIKSTSEYFEDTPAGRFMENIIANVAQFDNDVRTERSIGGMKEAVRDGRYVWPAPFGYSNVRINGKATIKPNEFAPFVIKAFTMMAENHFTIENIRQTLISEGMKSTYGKPLAKSTFYSLLRSEVYIGRINKFGERHQGTYEAIIPESLFNTVQRILSGKSAQNNRSQVCGDFPLKRLLYHPTGRLLTGCWSQGRKKKYPYYLIHTTGINIRKEVLENNFKQWLNQSFRLDVTHFDKLAALTKTLTKTKLIERNVSLVEINKEVEKLKMKRVSILEKNIEGVISNEFCKEQIQLIDFSIYNLEQNINQAKSPTINYESLLQIIRKLMLNPAELWDAAAPEEKVKLQWFYFPKGIEFDGNCCQTSKICILYKLKQTISNAKSEMVTHSDSKSNTDFKQIPLSLENNIDIKRNNQSITTQQLNVIVEEFANEANQLISFFK
jgi:site-specific DNA recombinase